MKPLHLALGIGTLGGLLLFAFVPVSTLSPQTAATAYAQSTPSVSFTQEEVQGKEGSTIYLRVKLDTPVTKTTKVTIKLTPDQGTTSRDIPGLTGTKTVTFYKNGTQTKTVAIRTSRTAAEGDKSLTASITKVGNTTVQGDTARVLVKDQKSSTSLANNQNTNTQTQNTTTPPTDCKQYEGVIPGESRKARVEIFPPFQTSPILTLVSDTEAKRELASVREDFTFLTYTGAGTGITLTPGVIRAYRFTTGEYTEAMRNKHQSFNLGANVQQAQDVPGAAVIMSISECPGNVSSPELDSCWSFLQGGMGDTSFGRIDAAIGKYAANKGLCLLQENKTYYLNITAGFEYRNDDAPTGAPFIGYRFSGPELGDPIDPNAPVGGLHGAGSGYKVYPGKLATTMFVFGDNFSPLGTLGVIEFLKNKTALYSEFRRIRQDFMAEGQRRVQACRDAIAAGRRCSP